MSSANELKIFFLGDTKNFEKAVSTVTSKSGGLKKALVGVTAGVSLLGLGKSVLDTAKHFETAALSARDFAKIAGVTGTEAARWQEAANSIGVDADVVQNAFAKMNAAIGTDGVKATGKLDKAKEANAAASLRVQKAQERYNAAVAKSGKDSTSAKNAALSLHTAQEKLAKSGDKIKTIATAGTGAFADFGIQIAKTKDGMVDTNETFLNAIEFLKNETDATVADAAAKKIFGKSFQDLAPLIAQGRAGLESQLAQVSPAQANIGTADSIAKAERFQAAMDNLGDRFEQIKLTLGVGVIPVLAALFQWLSVLPAPVFAFAAGFVALGVAVSRVSALLTIFAANPWIAGILAGIAIVYLLVKNWDAVTAAIDRAAVATQNFVAKITGPLYGPIKAIANLFGAHLGEGGAQLNTDSPVIQDYLKKQGKSFAGGGWVPGPLGSPQVILAHGGEYVSAGGPGMVVNQTVLVQAVNSYDMNKNLEREARLALRGSGRR